MSVLGCRPCLVLQTWQAKSQGPLEWNNRTRDSVQLTAVHVSFRASRQSVSPIVCLVWCQQEAQQASERAARAERELEATQEHIHQQLQHRLVEMESQARDAQRALRALEEERDAVSQQLRIAQVSAC